MLSFKSFKNVLLNPTKLNPANVSLKIKRYASQRSFERLMQDVVGLSNIYTHAFLEELKRSSFLDDLKKQIQKFNVPGVDFDSRWLVCEQDWHAAIYCIIRAMKPEIIVETGVASGVSTAFILKALHDNQKGKLYSIDLPPRKNKEGKLPAGINWELPGSIEPGFAVLPSLTDRWELILASSKETLPPLLNKLKQIDIFLHDSDHSYEYMAWEYNAAWPYIKNGGVLLSDDVSLNTALIDFCKKKRLNYFEFGRKIGITKK